MQPGRSFDKESNEKPSLHETGKYAAARSSRSRAIVTLGFSGNVPTETGEITRRLGMWSWRSDSQSRGYIASFGKLHDDRR